MQRRRPHARPHVGVQDGGPEEGFDNVRVAGLTRGVQRSAPLSVCRYKRAARHKQRYAQAHEAALKRPQKCKPALRPLG